MSLCNTITGSLELLKLEYMFMIGPAVHDQLRELKVQLAFYKVIVVLYSLFIILRIFCCQH